jgi:hypothetical protein
MRRATVGFEISLGEPDQAGQPAEFRRIAGNAAARRPGDWHAFKDAGRFLLC